MKTKIIYLGYECGDHCCCKHRHECKYANGFHIRFCRFLHNLDVRIYNFFRYRLKIKLPHIPIYFSPKWDEFSGTSTCPFHLLEQTHCHRCEHCIGMTDSYDFICRWSYEDRKTYDTNEWQHQCSKYSRDKR